MFLNRAASLISSIRHPGSVQQLTNLFHKQCALLTKSSELKNPNPKSQNLWDQTKTPDPVERINEHLKTNNVGRMFAVVHVAGKQFKVTAGDVILVEGYWQPKNGDRLRLDKVLLAGAQDFSLIGRPILQKGLVDVQATVIEKSLSHTRTQFKKKRRKQFMRINFQRCETTMLRINSINLVNLVNDKESSADGYEIY